MKLHLSSKLNEFICKTLRKRNEPQPRSATLRLLNFYSYIGFNTFIQTLYTHTQTHTHRESHPFLFKHVAPEPERKNKDESDGSRTSDDIASPSTSSSNRHPSYDLAGRQQSDLFAIRWKTHKTFAHNQKCAIAVTLLQFIQFIWS